MDRAPFEAGDECDRWNRRGDEVVRKTGETGVVDDEPERVIGGRPARPNRPAVLDYTAGVARLIEQEILETVDVVVRRGDHRQKEEEEIGRRRAKPLPARHGSHYTTDTGGARRSNRLACVQAAGTLPNLLARDGAVVTR